jgi:ribosome-binding factor A
MSQEEFPSGRSYRTLRIQRAVAEAFELDLLPSLEDPLLSDLHVISVEVTANLSSARITVGPSVTTEHSDEDIQHALDKAAAWLRSELASVLRIKRLPALRLRYVRLPLFSMTMNGMKGGSA